VLRVAYACIAVDNVRARRRVVFLNLGGGPSRSTSGFGFTEGGLAHAVNAFSPLADEYDVDVACPNVGAESDLEELTHAGVRIHCPPRPALVRWANIGELSLSERSLHAAFHWPAIASAYVTAYILTAKLQPDIVLANGIFGSFLLGRHRDRWPCIAVIHHLYHDAWTYGALHGPSGPVPPFEKSLIQRLDVDGIAVVNPAVESRLREAKGQSCIVSFVGNGVDTNRYAFRTDKDTDCLVYIGRLREGKRVQDLIEAFAIVSSSRPRAVLHIVGDGPQRRSLEALAQTRGLGNRIAFHGFVSEDEKIALLRRASLYLSASRFEGFGIPLVEAMATGAVPVVTDIPAHRFVFRDRQVGWITSSPAEMADAVLALLDDDLLRRTKAREGRWLVEQEWTWMGVARRYHGLIETVLRTRKLRGTRLANPG